MSMKSETLSHMIQINIKITLSQKNISKYIKGKQKGWRPRSLTYSNKDLQSEKM